MAVNFLGRNLLNSVRKKTVDGYTFSMILMNSLKRHLCSTYIGKVSDLPEQHRTYLDHFSKYCLGGEWYRDPRHPLNIHRLDGRTENIVYKISIQDHISITNGQDRTILMHIYGRSAPGRDNVELLRIIGGHKLGPRILCATDEARVEQYVTTSELKYLDIVNSSKDLAEHLARFHSISIPRTARNAMWLELMLDTLLEGAMAVLNGNTREFQGSSQLRQLKGFDLQEAKSTIMEAIKPVKSPIVMAHNNLQIGNILQTDESAQIKSRLIFKGTEHSAYNYRGFDLANFYLQLCYDRQGDEDNVLVNFRQDRVPGQDWMFKLLKDYLQVAHSRRPSEESLVQLYEEVVAFFPTVHLMWALRAIGRCTDLEDSVATSYLEYALRRLESVGLTEQNSQTGATDTDFISPEFAI